jgi:hypothetical protein
MTEHITLAGTVKKLIDRSLVNAASSNLFDRSRSPLRRSSNPHHLQMGSRKKNRSNNATPSRSSLTTIAGSRRTGKKFWQHHNKTFNKHLFDEQRGSLQ